MLEKVFGIVEFKTGIGFALEIDGKTIVFALGIDCETFIFAWIMLE